MRTHLCIDVRHVRIGRSDRRNRDASGHKRQDCADGPACCSECHGTKAVKRFVEVRKAILKLICFSAWNSRMPKPECRLVAQSARCKLEAVGRTYWNPVTVK